MVVQTWIVPRVKVALRAKEETHSVAPVAIQARAPEVVQMANRHGAGVQSTSRRLIRSQRHHELSFQLPEAAMSVSYKTLPVMMKFSVEVAQLR